jgi:pimeloyl-ACP methyl ester carboxylesterase
MVAVMHGRALSCAAGALPAHVSLVLAHSTLAKEPAMLLMPFPLLLLLPVMLLSLGLLGGGAYLLWAWYAGLLTGLGVLVAGLALLLWTVAGRWVILGLRRAGQDEPRMTREGEAQRLRRPDGSELQVELYGSAAAPPLILTHGWGVNGTVWHYAKRQLADRFRLIVWDLPGLGRSRGAADHAAALETMAHDLRAVLELAGGRPAILLGHSIGGMIILTFCRLYPECLGRQVAGLALVNTTFTNPVRTTTASGLLRVLQRPVLEPLLHLMMWLAPLMWLMNWLSYLNGTLHLLAALTGFAGRETRGQLEFATRFGIREWPGVVARGTLAMLRYDASTTLPELPLPVLIVAGQQDRLTTPEASVAMQRAIPDADLVVLEPAGHMGLLEQHRAFATAIATFSDRVLAASGR